METSFGKISLRDFLRVVYKYRFLTLAILITVMVSIYIGMQMITPTYQASVKMLVTGKMPKDIEYERSLGQGSLISTHMNMVFSKTVLERAARALRLDERPIDYEKDYATKIKRFFIERNANKIRKDIEGMGPDERRAFYLDRALSILKSSISTSKVISYSATGREDSSLFEIVATDFHPSEAVRMANVVSRSYVIYDLETQIAELTLMYGEMNPTVIKLKDFINKMEGTLNDRLLSDIDALGPASVKIVSQAEYAMPVTQRWGFNIYIIGFILSIVSGITISFGLEYMSETVKTAKDIDRHFKIPFLGSIPKRKKKDTLIMANPSASDKLECVRAFRSVGDKVFLFTKERGIRSILANSLSNPSDSSAVVANLGIYLSRDIGKRVLIIDANFGYPSISRIFGLNANPDIIDLFEGKCTVDEAIKDLGNDLYLLSSRAVQFRPIKLVDSPFMADLIKELKERFDLLLIDCQLNPLRDTVPVILSSYSDWVMMVLSEGKDRYYTVNLSLNLIKQRNGVKVFSVLNNRTKDLPKLLKKVT
ncbi:MAG: hypothetical protein Fur0020_00130 [Thermodesulfovibrionia bacterium]